MVQTGERQIYAEGSITPDYQSLMEYMFAGDNRLRKAIISTLFPGEVALPADDFDSLKKQGIIQYDGFTDTKIAGTFVRSQKGYTDIIIPGKADIPERQMNGIEVIRFNDSYRIGNEIAGIFGMGLFERFDGDSIEFDFKDRKIRIYSRSQGVNIHAN